MNPLKKLTFQLLLQCTLVTLLKKALNTISIFCFLCYFTLMYTYNIYNEYLCEIVEFNFRDSLSRVY